MQPIFFKRSVKKKNQKIFQTKLAFKPLGAILKKFKSRIFLEGFFKGPSSLM